LKAYINEIVVRDAFNNASYMNNIASEALELKVGSIESL
jgi:hypothetical protein